MSHQQYQNCIDACYACAIACSHCAAECLKEEKVQDLKRCIQLDLECASICKSSADLMSLGSSFSSDIGPAALRSFDRALLGSELCKTA